MILNPSILHLKNEINKMSLTLSTKRKRRRYLVYSNHTENTEIFSEFLINFTGMYGADLLDLLYVTLENESHSILNSKLTSHHITN